MAASTANASRAPSSRFRSPTSSNRRSRSSRIFSTTRSCRPPPSAKRIEREVASRFPVPLPELFDALLDAFENTDVIRHRGTAHVEDAAERGVFHLQVACIAGELH